MSDDDRLEFIDDIEPVVPGVRPWRILVVDDDDATLSATRFVLGDVRILDRPVEIVSAVSGQEARIILQRDQDFAVAFVDVVMETPDAGLRLVEWIRGQQGLTMLRIVIRTGQPGTAPELEVIRRYDINDYRQKADLDRTRLETILISGIRAFHQLLQLEAHRVGLTKIVAATESLMSQHSFDAFAEGVLNQICHISGSREEGVLIARRRGRGVDPEEEPKIVAAAGQFTGLLGHSCSELPAPLVAKLKALRKEPAGSVRCVENEGLMRLTSPSGGELLVHFVLDHLLSEFDIGLLTLFASKVTVALENVGLYEELERSAFLDPVTGLLNARGWRRTLDDDKTGTIALARLPDLEVVQSLFGIEVASELGKSIGDRLSSHFAGEGRVARISTTGFGVLLRGDELPADVHQVLAKPVAMQEAEIALNSGVVFSTDGRSALENFDRALTAYPSIKADGSVIPYDPAVLDELGRHFETLRQLGSALAEDRLLVHFQPQFDMSTRRIVGVEALVRARTREGRLVPPLHFIPIAEETGLIIDLGQRMSQIALAQLADWNRTSGRISLSINVSPRELATPGLSDRLVELIATAGISVDQIMIEITESAYASADSATFRTISDLVAKGFRLSIDDFGTGHSSLARLSSLPASELKLDRSFCRDVATDPRTRDVAALVIDLGRKLGISVLAEGIETEEQFAVLKELGCDLGQGYLMGRPVPGPDLTALIAAGTG